jgi:hypothetical protein
MNSNVYKVKMSRKPDKNQKPRLKMLFKNSISGKVNITLSTTKKLQLSAEFFLDSKPLSKKAHSRSLLPGLQSSRHHIHVIVAQSCISSDVFLACSSSAMRFGPETVVPQISELKISSGAADQDPGKKKNGPKSP